jgi:hypothetical protein
VRSAAQQGEPTPLEVHAGPIDVQECTTKPVTISIRAAGYEEAVFNNVQFKPGDVQRFELRPATPARLRLVTTDGQAVVGAKVRFFNKTSDLAGSGPFPTNGIGGPVWAESAPDGTVLLDSLQVINPLYPNLGNSMYFFYVEAEGFPGKFLGPVQAGNNLGDVVLSPPLEVSGEIRGTAEELDRFDAEWDQPFDQKTDKSDFQYAVSQRLETTREGDKLTFKLTGLRPGKLRFIMSFAKRPHQVSHSYERRDPKGSDVLVELDVTESTSGVVLTPKGRE